MPNGGKLRNVIGSVRYIVALCVARHYNFKLVAAAFDTAQKKLTVNKSARVCVESFVEDYHITIIFALKNRAKQLRVILKNLFFSHIGHILKQLVVAFRQDHCNTRNVSQHFYFARFTVLKKLCEYNPHSVARGSYGRACRSGGFSFAEAVIQLYHLSTCLYALGFYYTENP